MDSIWQKMWDFIFGTDKKPTPPPSLIPPRRKPKQKRKRGEHKTDDTEITEANQSYLMPSYY